MDGYQLQIDELGKLITDLETAADRMTDANKRLGGSRFFGELGNDRLGEAGGEFEDAWEYGIEQLGDSAEDVTERLKQAKGKYQELEAEYGDLFQGERFANTGEPDGKVGGGVTGGIQDILGGSR
ncbi:hypothetical protein [Amycolatopsis anabasis]|uniref:hypothetical protein n=1 Tax=Amycolatopsis anabasis TaxID=1840409 RepID=UPI00131B5514|nr:hypothetical protein [Amycolatopsis anabasis]